MSGRTVYKVRSIVWNYFTKINIDTAKCDLCSSSMSIKGGSTGNLIRHLRLKHITSMELDQAQTYINNLEENDDAPMPNNSKHCYSTINPIPSTYLLSKQRKKKRQQQRGIAQSTFIPISVTRSKAIDEQLVKLIVKDYQPFSFVEHFQLKTIVQMLNPGYNLPSRKMISNLLIPHLYTKVSEEIREQLKLVSAVTVTTDGWTSINNESYLAITVHFINENCLFKSYLLDCFKYGEKHTAENLSNEIRHVLHEWLVFDKVVAVVSNNTANVTAAIRICGWKQVPCFANSLDLIVQAGIQEIKSVIDKVRSVVEFFKQNPQATENLKQVLTHTGFPEIKLKQDAPTRWNSTYDMLFRIKEMKEPLLSTIALTYSASSLEQLTENDWAVIDNACEVLKCFKEVTVEISAEQNVTLSKIILFSKALKRHCYKMLNEHNAPIEVRNMLNKIIEQLHKRFLKLEDDKVFAEATILDPRFKKYGFAEERAFERGKLSLMSLAGKINILNEQTGKDVIVDVPVKNTRELEESTIWGDFDDKTSQLVQSENATDAVLIEMNKYIEEPQLKRTGNPLLWWKQRHTLYPRLFQLMKKRLCIVATSVPCDRLFSKGGIVLAERRSRLSASKVSKIVFLNFNFDNE